MTSDFSIETLTFGVLCHQPPNLTYTFNFIWLALTLLQRRSESGGDLIFNGCY